MSENSIQYTWPAEFPDGVPGDEIAPAGGKVYRLVDQLPPTENDFRMHKIDNPGYRYKAKDRHKAYGVSFWSKMQEVIRAKERYSAPEQFGNKLIACGNLVPELGVIPKELSKDGHITLWKQVGALPHLYVCNEEEIV